MLEPSLSEPLRSTMRLSGEPLATSVRFKLVISARKTEVAITARAMTPIVSAVRPSRARTLRTGYESGRPIRPAPSRSGASEDLPQRGRDRLVGRAVRGGDPGDETDDDREPDPLGDDRRAHEESRERPELRAPATARRLHRGGERVREERARAARD